MKQEYESIVKNEVQRAICSDEDARRFGSLRLERLEAETLFRPCVVEAGRACLGSIPGRLAATERKADVDGQRATPILLVRRGKQLQPARRQQRPRPSRRPGLSIAGRR